MTVLHGLGCCHQDSNVRFVCVSRSLDRVMLSDGMDTACALSGCRVACHGEERLELAVQGDIVMEGQNVCAPLNLAHFF